MKRKKIKKKNYLILIILLLLLVTPGIVTFSKYVLEKTGVFNFNLKGVKFDDENLVVASYIDYSDTTNTLLNPERGFFVQQEVVLSNPYSESDKTEILTGTENVKIEMAGSDITLARLIVYLTNYKDSDISNEWLSGLNDICDSYRQDGYKIIVRFAYDTTENSDPTDFDQILNHMDQLSSFFTTNEDVIHAVELGFIGPWGESHSSTYATSEYRNQILDKALDVVPSSIQLLVRRPLYYKDYFGDGYFDHKLGYSDEDKARVGIYNDGYLSTITDLGTYETEDRDEELKWMNYLSQYTISGGEVVHLDGYDGYYDVESAIEDMTKTHMNYLNKSYDQVVLDSWKNTNIDSNIDSIYNSLSAYKYFADKLGYRFVVKEVKLPDYTVEQGSYLHFSFSIENTGFGNLINYRNVELILEKDGKYYKTKTVIDPRYWFSGEVTTEKLVMKLPSNIETGEWNIYVSLPDIDESLHTHENYYVKFANDDIWQTELNGNYLGTITVSEASNTSDKGFYQVNTVDDLQEDESQLYEVERSVVIDGTETTKFEWMSSDIVYEEASDTVYLRSDDEYLYIYSKTDLDIMNTYINIYFSTIDSALLENYNYAVQNDLLYPYSVGTGFGTAITGVKNAKDTGFEYRIAFSDLNISSIDELRGFKIEYLNTSWQAENSFVIALENPGMTVDGKISYTSEYSQSDIFYSDENKTIYTKIYDDYLYVYAYDSTITVTDTPNISIYIGSNDTTKTSTKDGYVLWYETVLVPCTYDGCDSSNALSGYIHSRGISDGVEFKIPISVIGIDSIDDIRNLKILYRNSSWEEIKTTEIEYTMTLSDLDGKTAIVAKKPSDWETIYTYIYGDTVPFSWYGIRMYKLTDALEDDTYAYIIPDDMTYAYVIFNNSSIQIPGMNMDLFRVDQGQIKYWNGNLETNNVNNWNNYDGSVSEDKNIYFKFKILDGQTQTAACAYVYDDSTEYVAWPGITLTDDDSDGYWEGAFDASNIGSNLRVIFNNCNNGYQAPSANDPGMLIKPGITIGYWDSVWRVLQDN